jgi:beta-lactamase class D
VRAAIMVLVVACKGSESSEPPVRTEVHEHAGIRFAAPAGSHYAKSNPDTEVVAGPGYRVTLEKQRYRSSLKTWQGIVESEPGSSKVTGTKTERGWDIAYHSTVATTAVYLRYATLAVGEQYLCTYDDEDSTDTKTADAICRSIELARPVPQPAIDVATLKRLWPDGCFAIKDANGVVHESDHERCAKPRRPYSTFKLANALLGVDARIFDGADAPMRWDKVNVPFEERWRGDWTEPHTLLSGFVVSAVPYFRTLALDLGEPRMREGLAKLDYGNRDLSGGLDKFWLSGGLRISALQQVAFVDALARGKLAVSEHAQDVVREISRLDDRPNAILHGKTGTGPIEDRKGGWIAWHVGWVYRDSSVLPYAMWFETEASDLDLVRRMREKRLRGTLHALGVFPEEP